MGEVRLVVVRECQGLLLGEIYKSKLEAHGVPVLLRYEAAGPVIGITVDGLGRVRVLVPEAFAGEAEQLLAEEAEPPAEALAQEIESLPNGPGEPENDPTA
jgi:hypothetical protein